MKDRLEKIISDYKVNAKYFQYLKAKLPNNNIKYDNNKVLELLKGYDSTNINTVKLENGYSTTAYTKMYNSMESNGQLIDLNYALSKYSSGSYIIIGTPEINVTY
jgi:Tfp pilus assembly protein FimT